ncbi:MAG: YihY/virulence factor BrkB family protein [Bacteroidota bacterium]
MAKVDAAKVHKFVKHDIWHVKLDKIPRWQRGAIKTVRICILAIKDFDKKDLSLRATALTLYTLLSVVPIVALIFGISKGFGLEEYLAQEMKEAFSSQPVVLENILNYSHNMLQTTKGGVIAGVGFALLMWTVLQVLGNIEDAFNSIWYVTKPRTLIRKFTDYLSIMLVAPLFIIVSGAANIFISTQVTNILAGLHFLGETGSSLVFMALQVLPYLTTSILFFFIYLVMPNTRVKPRAALTAGIIAGCIFQLFQWGYIAFQIGVSRYNAIYGSFASIPLFITWLQFSWIIVLLGSEIGYSVQNIAVFQDEQLTGKFSHKMRMLYSLYIIHLVTKRFKHAAPPPDAVDIAKRLSIPLSLCRQLLNNMQQADLVAQTVEKEGVKEYCFVPALDIQFLTVGFIINKLESLGELSKHDGDEAELFHRIKVNYIELERAINNSEANKHILDF